MCRVSSYRVYDKCVYRGNVPYAPSRSIFTNSGMAPEQSMFLERKMGFIDNYAYMVGFIAMYACM
jgi:hypothetical protein